MKKNALARALLAASLALGLVAPAAALDRLLPPARVKDNGDVRLSDDLKIGRFQGGSYVSTPQGVENLGPNVYTPSVPIPSSTNSTLIPNGVWQSNAWAYRYSSGADFGNTTPVNAQRLIRCTAIQDYKFYESCDNIDFYANSGHVEPWFPSTAYALGARVKTGRRVYVAIQAGTSAPSGQGPSNTASSEPDNGVIWRYDGDTFLGAKSAWTLTAKADANSNKVWGMNPNLFLGNGFRDEAFGMELDVTNYSGHDHVDNDPYPDVKGIWVGGSYNSTGLSGMSVGGFPDASTPTKPAWTYGFYCENATTARSSCFEDWSNAANGFHTPSFRTKTYDLFLQSSSQSALKASGTYSDAAISTEGATLGAGAHAMKVAAGQDVCFNGGNACWFWNSADSRMKLKVNGFVVYSVDSNGLIRSKGGAVTDANP